MKRRSLPGQINRRAVWKYPPKGTHNALRTTEEFPGKDFALKGANWLNLTARSVVPLERRKVFAQRCFNAAIKQCASAMAKAEKRNSKQEAQRLREIIVWLRGYRPL